MKILPQIPLNEIPATRRVSSNTELKQYLADQGVFWETNIQAWVQETAYLGNLEIVKAGNPEFSLTEIDGTTGKGGRIWRAGRAGSIYQAQTAVRIHYQANALAMIANTLRPILSDVIKQRFPNSRLQRLARDWVWFLVRRGVDDRGRAEFLGGSVNVPIDIYDTLYLVPEGKYPADYAWFANSLAKLGHRQRRPQRRRKDSPAVPRDRRLGYLGDAVKRMRARRMPGVVVWGMNVKTGLTASSARNDRGYIPAIGLSFNQRLANPTGVN